MYTAVVLDKLDRAKLINIMLEDLAVVPPWWEWIADHCTINLGSSENGPARGRLGEEVKLRVKRFAIDDRVAAVEVETKVPSVNKIKHVTLAVNRKNGGKPKHSNDLKGWKQIPEFEISGIIREVG